jgi:hypothetical protein
VSVRLCISPLILLGGLWDRLAVCAPHIFCFLCGPCCIREAYEITLLSVCLCALPNIFCFVLYAVRVVSKETEWLLLPRTYPLLLNLIWNDKKWGIRSCHSLVSATFLCVYTYERIYSYVYILSGGGVTINGFWIYDRIHWTLWHSAWLHFTFHYHTRTLMSIVTSSLPLLGNGFQRWTFPFLWVPEWSPASAISF